MRRLFPEAERIAQDSGRPDPGSDDLVLAALPLPDGAARRALAASGVSAATLRRATLEVRATAAAPATDDAPARRAPSEPSMQMVFHRAVGIAKADRSHVRSRDILLAATESPDQTVHRALRALGVEPDRVRDALDADAPP